MSAVRPLGARVVRQHQAAPNVSRMTDALPVSERPPGHAVHPAARAVVDPDAYEECAPSLYVYRLRRGEDQHTGVVGEVGVEAFVSGQVRGHEAVQPDRVESLVELFASAEVRSELVALLHLPGPRIADVLASTVGDEPILRFTGPDAWEQTVWRVPDAAAGPLADELSKAVHYIADGHHRVAASLRVWRRTGRPADAAVMCVMYPMDGLHLLAFHRRVIGPVSVEDVLGHLSGSFDVRDVAGPEQAAGCFVLYAGGRWYDVASPETRPAGAAGLDVSILDRKVLGPLLGPSGSDRLEISAGPSAELTRACDEDGGVLFVLRPPTLDQLVGIADRGEVMPPKTTYFDPKPYAGIFLR